jgi:hypothetical protein
VRAAGAGDGADAGCGAGAGLPGGGEAVGVAGDVDDVVGGGEWVGHRRHELDHVAEVGVLVPDRRQVQVPPAPLKSNT